MWKGIAGLALTKKREFKIRLYVCCSDSVGVCENVCCVAAVVKDSGSLSLGVLRNMLHVCVRDVMDVVFTVCIVYAWSCRCSCMGRMSVSSCRCCLFGSCVHPVTVLNAAFCMPCSSLMLVKDARGYHMEEYIGMCLCVYCDVVMCVLYVSFGPKV